MRVLVTGGRGFVGTRLVARLSERGDEVVATDREVDVAPVRYPPVVLMMPLGLPVVQEV